MDKLRVGELFAGIGGFGKGLEDTGGFEVVWQVENSEYCRKVLNKHWPAVPCHGDITTIDWRDVPAVDLVCGGFPCQPFSTAGKQRGKADNRFLWPEVVRCLDTLRPTWFLGENVPGIINMALDQVCTDLEGLGYQVWPVCIPACAVDAPHIRQRVWIMAYTASQRGRQEADKRRVDGPSQDVAHRDKQRSLQTPRDATKPSRDESKDRVSFRDGDNVADAPCELLNGSRAARKTGRRQSTDLSAGVSYADGQHAGRTAKPRQEYRERLLESSVGGVAARLSARMDRDRLSVWPSEPADIPRVATGVKHRVDRLKGLGNAVVPAVVETLGRMILEADKQLNVHN